MVENAVSLRKELKRRTHPCSAVNLVVDQMLKPLVESGPQKDPALERQSSVTAVHHLFIDKLIIFFFRNISEYMKN